MIIDHPLARLAALPGTAPAHTLPVYLPREVEILVKSVAVPVVGLGSRMAGLVSCTLAPWTVPGRVDEGTLAPWTVPGRVDEGTLALTLHTPPLPMCGLDAPGRGFLTAARIAECARALGATICGHDNCARYRLAVTRPGVTVRVHTGPATGHVIVAGLVTALLFWLLVVREEELAAWPESPGSRGGCCCFPGSQQLWVDGRARPCGCG